MPDTPGTTTAMDEVAAAAMAAVAAGPDGAWPVEVEVCDAHSNDRAELRYADGRSLVVKRARHDWAAERFAASRLAAVLLRRRTGVLAPAHVEVPAVGGLAVEAYWRIDLPTLAEVLPDLPARRRPALLRSWGRLMRRVHSVRPSGHGPLAAAMRRPSPLAAHLTRDLADRLAPALAEAWPAAGGVADALLRRAPSVAARVEGSGPVLVHNDLHAGNVLCARRGGAWRCVGVLDLEAAFAGPPEADAAHVQVLHGPALGIALPAGWVAEALRGYGRPLDGAALAWFRAYHLLNLGYHAATCGWADHAADLLRLARADLGALPAALRAPAPSPALSRRSPERAGSSA